MDYMIKRDSMGRFVRGSIPKVSFEKGHIPWNSGKKHNLVTREKMSESRKEFYKNNPHPKGMLGKGRENHWNWQGGITPLNKLLRKKSMWKIWREAIFLRDNFTCQNPNCEFCDNRIGVMLHPHHIKPLALFPELAFDVRNGITYCAEFHLKSGLHREMQKEC